MPRHELTDEERRKGQAKGAQTKLMRAHERRERVADELMGALDRATQRLLELIDSEDPAVALRAVVALFDRVLGRPRQAHEHSGMVTVQLETEVVRAKLDTIIERRAQALADRNGHEEA